MYRPKFNRTLSISFLTLLFLSTSYAQAQPDQFTDDVFDAKLQVILASDRTMGSGRMPSNLSAITAALRRDFALTNFHVIDTQIGRLADRGALETKGAVEMDQSAAVSGSPAYTEWSIGDSRTNGSAVTIGSFRYMIRLSTRKALADAEPGKPGTVVAYESFGQSLKRLSVPDSVPTIIGSIALPKGTGTLFLVLTVSNSGNNKQSGTFQ